MRPSPPSIRKRIAPLAAAGALLLCLAPPAPGAGAQGRRGAPASDEQFETLIHLLPPVSRELSGKTRFESLLTDPGVHDVVFRVDGELVARRRSPPWAATLTLASPPREQRVRVEARNRFERVLAADEVVVNRPLRPLRVALSSIETSPEGLVARAEVSIPEELELERLAVYLGEEFQRSYFPDEIPDGELEIVLAKAAPGGRDFVRIVAHLADGRTIEDVGLVGSGFAEKVDVRLVQLQVVVTNQRGLPMRGLQKKHFRISQDGRESAPAGLFPGDEVTLLLGLALDSSGSMEPIWPETIDATADFLGETLSERDQGFLVDFDSRLRLVQERTGDKPRLIQALNELRPEGGTALYDSVLFALLQFDRQPGRRGLVVLTDGFDVESQADPEWAVRLARDLGVPIFALVIDSHEALARVPLSRGISAGIDDPRAAVQALRALTDPSGGRLYRVGSTEQLVRALGLVHAELRNQYVLTYTTDAPPAPGRPPRVEVVAPDHPGLEAKVVFGADQVY